MRLVMLGTGPFAVPILASLLDSTHEVAALVTRPSVTAQTRGKSKTPPNPMRALAESRSLRILAPESINDAAARSELANLQCDLMVVCDYGQILSPETLAVTPLGGINLHGSLLPKYRGAAPVQWAVWSGEQETGITVIHMTPRLDAGPILIQAKTAIGPTETAAELEPRLAEMGVQPIIDAIALLEKWDRVLPIGMRQDAGQASRAPRLKKNDGDVDWSKSAEQIYCQFRAVQPWPALFTHFSHAGREPLRVILEHITPGPAEKPLQPGEISPKADHWEVGTGQGVIRVHKLQPAGRTAMLTSEFQRGYPLEPGDRFISLKDLPPAK